MELNNLNFPPNILSLKSNKSNFSTLVRTPPPGWAPGGLVSLFAEPPFFSSPFHSHGKKIDDDHDDDIYIMMRRRRRMRKRRRRRKEAAVDCGAAGRRLN